MPSITESREVLAAAYLGPNKSRCRRLVHAVFVDRDRRAIEALCRRVSTNALADRNASDPAARVTCEHCQRALRRLQAGRPADAD